MFNIPKRNFNSKKTTVLGTQLPAVMKRAIAKKAMDIGMSQNELISIVLDQFIAAAGEKKTPLTSKGTFDKGKIEQLTLRLDKALVDAIGDAGEARTPKLTKTQIVTLALDCYLSIP